MLYLLDDSVTHEHLPGHYQCLHMHTNNPCLLMLSLAQPRSYWAGFKKQSFLKHTV